MKTKRLDFNYRSLAMTSYIELVGSIPSRQTYNASSGEYAPDYTLEGSALVLQPHVVVMSDELGAERGDVTASSNLTNIKWTEVVTDSSTVISSANEKYKITTSGVNKGRIEMMRNVPAGSALTLVFEADYIDQRTNERHHQRVPFRVTCENEVSQPTLSIDRPTTTLWNPFRDGKTLEYNCSLKIDGKDVDVSKRTFVWEKKRTDGTWTQIGSDEHDDFGWSVTNDGATYRQHMDYIGEKQDMRVRAGYGSIAIGTVNESMAVYFTMVRRLPDYDYDYINVPDNIEPGTTTVYPEPMVQDREGVVPNALEELTASWYTAAGTASDNPVMELVATGPSPAISTDQTNINGMIIGLEMKDRGNYKKVVDGGKLVTITIDGKEYAVIDK